MENSITALSDKIGIKGSRSDESKCLMRSLGVVAMIMLIRFIGTSIRRQVMERIEPIVLLRGRRSEQAVQIRRRQSLLRVQILSSI